jgi:NAD(P)H-dependent flavin oxidoreductase YrpB (nitropropane dioxygenase family)
VQVGSLFALCQESGLEPSLRARVLEQVREGAARVFTDPLASPTGFPFKVLGLEGTLSEAEVYERRTRCCDLGYLRELYRRPDATLGYRCPGEPVEDYLRKGGRIEDTRGRKCICNGLLATAGLGLGRAEGPEPAIVTSGDDLGAVSRLRNGRTSLYSAAEAVAYLGGLAGH